MEPSTIAASEHNLMMQADSLGTNSFNYESGISKIQEMFSNIAPTSNESLAAPKVEKMDSPLNMLKETASDYVSRERELNIGLRTMTATPVSTQGALESFEQQRKIMFEMQLAYQEKSINGAMLLSTGKSAESFVKTLMKSQ